MPKLLDLLAESMSGMPDPFLLARPDDQGELRCRYANAAAAVQFATDQAQLSGMPLTALLPGQSPAVLAQQLLEVHRVGEPLVLDDAGYALGGAAAQTLVLDLMVYRVGRSRDPHLAITWRSGTQTRGLGARNLQLSANKSVLALLSEGVLVQDEVGKVLLANPAALNIMGMSWEDISNQEPRVRGWRAIREDGSEIPPGQTPGARALATGEAVHDVVVGVVIGGLPPRWLLVNSDPSPVIPGLGRSVTSTLTDITRYRQARLDLAAADRQYVEVTDALADPLLVLEPVLSGPHGDEIVDLIIDRANRAGQVFLAGIPLADHERIMTQLLAHPTGARGTQTMSDLVLPAAQRVWDSGVAEQFLLEWPAADGQERTYQVKLERVRASTGARLAAISRDVTTDHRLRAALDQERLAAETDRARLAATLDSLLDPHATLRVIREGAEVVDVVYEDVNRAGAQFWNVDPAELIGKSVRQLLNPQLWLSVLGVLSGLIYRGEPLVLDDFSAPAGIFPGQRWFDVRAVLVGGSVSITWRDTTARHVAAAQLADSEARYRALAVASSDIIAHTSLSRTIEYLSPAVTAILGWVPEDLVGMNAEDLWHPDDRAGAAQLVADSGTAGRSAAGFRGRMRRSDGQYRWVEARLSRIAQTETPGRVEPAQPAGFVAVVRDVEHARRTELELQSSQDRLRSIIDTFVDPWVLLTAIRDQDGTIVNFEYADANLAACRANQMDREQLIGSLLLDVLPQHGPTGLIEMYARVVQTGEPLAVDDLPFAGVDGHERRFDNRAVKVGDGISFTWRDVTDRYLHRQELARMAAHDPLTGLVNREELRRRAAEMFDGSRSGDQPIAVLFADLDRFKQVNDTHGHDAGDVMLRTVALRMLENVRGGDVVARMGGDEFVLLLPGVPDRPCAARLAEKIRAAVSAPVRYDDHELTLTMSVGVALAHGEADPERAIREADAALYQAKTAGRDRVGMMAAPHGVQPYGH